jgi:hypothetical protein
VDALNPITHRPPLLPAPYSKAVLFGFLLLTPSLLYLTYPPNRSITFEYRFLESSQLHCVTNMATAVKVTSGVEPIPCSSPYPRPPASAYDKILTLKVGKPGHDPQFFRFYRGVLCHYSEYFKTMLNSDFREGGSGTLDVKDTTSDTL